PSEVLFDFNGFTNGETTNKKAEAPADIYFRKNPVSLHEYRQKFDHVLANLKAGNSFLVNLSVPTPIETNLSLKSIFAHSNAPYRFWLKDEFVCFSPEIFI